MTFKFLSMFHDFPRKFLFLEFSMIFHDLGNPGLNSPLVAPLHMLHYMLFQKHSLLADFKWPILV